MEDKNQVLLEVEKDLRDEIKMRIKQRDSYYVQAIAFCGALLAFGLTEFRDNVFGGIILSCGPFVALSYWRLLSDSYYVHDKIKAYLIRYIEKRLSKLVDGDFCLWQQYCDEAKGVSGKQKCAITCIMIVGSLVVFGMAIAFHWLMLSSSQWWLARFYGCLAIVWLLLSFLSYKSMKDKYRKLEEFERTSGDTTKKS